MKIKYPKFVANAFVVNDEGKIFLRTIDAEAKYTCIGSAVEWGRTIEKTLAKNVREKTNLELESFKLIDVVDGLRIDLPGERESVNLIFGNYLVKTKNNHKFNSDSKLESQWLLPSEWLKMEEDMFAPYIYEVIKKLI